MYRIDERRSQTLFAGIGTPQFSGDGGHGAHAELSHPRGLALDTRNMYIADRGNQRVRVVSVDGRIATLARARFRTGSTSIALGTSTSRP